MLRPKAAAAKDIPKAGRGFRRQIRNNDLPLEVPCLLSYCMAKQGQLFVLFGAACGGGFAVYEFKLWNGTRITIA